MKNKKLFIIPAVLLSFVALIWLWNYFSLQTSINAVIKEDIRNNGIDISVTYGSYVNPSVLVYDLRSIEGSKSPADVFRVFLQFVDKMKSKKYDEVLLQYKGNTKFKIKGDYFQKLGEEYSFQNPVYTMRTFPENLLKSDGSKAYEEWTGGLLGVMGKQMEDFNDFHKKWYLEDY